MTTEEWDVEKNAKAIEECAEENWRETSEAEAVALRVGLTGPAFDQLREQSRRIYSDSYGLAGEIRAGLAKSEAIERSRKIKAAYVAYAELYDRDVLPLIEKFKRITDRRN